MPPLQLHQRQMAEAVQKVLQVERKARTERFHISRNVTKGKLMKWKSKTEKQSSYPAASRSGPHNTDQRLKELRRRKEQHRKTLNDVGNKKEEPREQYSKAPEDLKRQLIDGAMKSVRACVCHPNTVLIVLASYQVASNPCAIWRGNYKVDPGACRKKPFWWR